MSDKSSPKPSAGKSAGKIVATGATSASKGAGSTAKSRTSGNHDELFDFLESPERPDEIGRLAQFRVLKVLGRGGMGTVFMAEDTRLHRIVALKVMLPSIAKKAVARDRFIREARATAAIEHDHIITIYEVCGDTEVPYAAMQYLKGLSLEGWLKAGKTLNVPQIMRIGKEIAKGLSAAHARQLIHRDIKPSNIWLDAANKGRVKILDFGLARPTNEETHLTQEGMILGTPAYMSPEQARGENVDERCDLFSLGCVLYRLCAGKLPFMGKDAMSMLLAITTAEPAPLRDQNHEIPAAFADLIHKLLAKKPVDRPPSAKDAVQTIQNIEREWIAGGKTVVGQGRAAPSGPHAVEEVDPALEESAITELELQETHIPGATPAPKRGRPWLFAGLGCASIVLVTMLCCLGIVLATDHGEVKIMAEDDDAQAFVEDVGLKVRHHQHKSPFPVKLGSNQLPSGGYTFEPAGLPAELHIEPNAFSLPRGESVEIKIRFATPKPAKPNLVLVTSDQARRLQREWASFLQIDETVKDSDAARPTLVLIPPGEFDMGSSDEQIRQYLNEAKKRFEFRPDVKRLEAEKPQHRVRISKPFYMSATEVTYGNFANFVKSSQYRTLPEKKEGGTGIDFAKDPVRKPSYNWKDTGFAQSNGHPVCNITWSDAEAYCRWLGKKEGKTFRLPTEAEWEYACRAGTTTHWFFGNDIRFKESDAGRYMWLSLPTKTPIFRVNSHPVAEKKTNDFGLFDVHGNIAEMCIDHFDPAYYETCARDNPTNDPKGPAFAPGGEHVIRGGSFLEPPHTARSAFRQGVDPMLGHVHVGFRIVCEISD